MLAIIFCTCAVDRLPAMQKWMLTAVSAWLTINNKSCRRTTKSRFANKTKIICVHKKGGKHHWDWTSMKQNHWSMKYRSLWLTFIIRPIITSHPLNRPRDIRQNHWTMKYRSLWPTFILRSKVVSRWLIIQKFEVHPSNSLQDISENHWTMKHRSLWPSFILRTKVVSHWLIFQKFVVHPSKSSRYVKSLDREK